MTPDDLRDDLRDVYFVLLVQIRGLGVLEADELARALVERDSASRWWSDDNAQ